MKNDKTEIDVLDELSKGACMGMDAIYFIQNKVTNASLKKELEHQYQEYKEIKEEIDNLYPNYNKEDKPHETNAMNKAMTFYGIKIKTILDNSTSKITELLLQGTNMGIVEGRKLLNHKETDEKIHNLIEKYVNMQEKAVEKLKQFL